MSISKSSRLLVFALFIVVGCVAGLDEDEEKVFELINSFVILIALLWVFLLFLLLSLCFLQNHYIVFLENKPVLNEVDVVETHLNLLMSVKKRWVNSNGK